MFLALQDAAVPEQFGAVVVLDPQDALDVGQAIQALRERLRAVPRLRQRIARVPPGCGPPVSIDDAEFAIERHVEHIDCPPPGDQTALLDVAATLVTRPLPVDRPLWAAALVTGLAHA